ncbi:MAG: hypothetical protein ACE5OP_14180, partial [Candidatus Glassbacteria bacterium]
KIPLILLFLLLHLSSSLEAQWCCGRLTLPTGALQQRPMSAGQYDIRVFYEFGRLDRTILGKEIVEDALQRSNNTQIVNTSISYGLTSDLTLTLLIPYKWTRLSLLNGLVIRRTSGIGDIAGIMKYRLLRPISPYRPEVAIGLGWKFPSGEYAARDDFGTLSVSQQVGSGASDFLLASYYNQAFGPVVAYSSQILRITGRNDRSYRFGNEFQYEGGLLLPMIFTTITPLVGIQGRISGRDSFDGPPQDPYGGGSARDSGGHWIYALSSLEVRNLLGMSFQVSVSLPIYQRVNGLQIADSITWQIGAAYNGFI